MILSFSTKWPKGMSEHMAGKPTYFIEKIWQGLYERRISAEPGQFSNLMDMGFEVFKHNIHNEKIHTIRRDEKNRWSAGNDIHFSINVRTKDQFQFAPVVKCVSVQEIEVKHHVGHIQINIDDECFGEVFHHGLDDIYDYTDDMLTLVQNDGFDSVEDFFAWFNTDFEGKIIHWTDLKY